MAKVPKPKVEQRSKSIHSRAARRAGSPSLGVNKSQRSLEAPEDSAAVRPHVLAAHHGDAIKKKKSKRETRQQRLRREKGLERAEIVMDQLEKKVAKSVVKEKTIKARRANWQELNGTTRLHKKHSKSTDIEDMQWEEDDAVTEPAREIAHTDISLPLKSQAATTAPEAGDIDEIE
ncbi:MAG: hypothetical protein M1834_004844 [Cirrosporium novae-zelandiae]|nr:MAG: hypothetical protein M1834_004844 [Cirrosporium novae-zelandiae]